MAVDRIGLYVRNGAPEKCMAVCYHILQMIPVIEPQHLITT